MEFPYRPKKNALNAPPPIPPRPPRPEDNRPPPLPPRISHNNAQSTAPRLEAAYPPPPPYQREATPQQVTHYPSPCHAEQRPQRWPRTQSTSLQGTPQASSAPSISHSWFPPPPSQAPPSQNNYRDPSHPSPADRKHRDQARSEAAVSRPSMQYNPPAKFTLKKCPSTNYRLMCSGTWYILPEAPEFRICTYCYEKHIRGSPLQASFHPWVSPAGAGIHCLFSSPRIESHLWPQALQSGSVQELLWFFRHRATIRNCDGTKGVGGSENVKWYSPKDNSRLPSFIACEACYEDVVTGTALQGQFEVHREKQPQGQIWVCDIAIDFIRRFLTNTPSWPQFSTEAARHLALPECEKNGGFMSGSSRQWYELRDRALGIAVCERCYRDFASQTDFESHFQPLRQPPRQQQCILGFWQARVIWHEALERKDFSLWRRTIIEYVQAPPCSSQTKPGAQMYQLNQGIDNFDVCPSCYVGLLKPHGIDIFFKRVQHPRTVETSCDLNPGSLRFLSYAPRLDEALITCTFSGFVDFTSRLCNLPLCPGIELVTNQRWYGTDDCRICLACYEEVVRGSELAQQLPLTPQIIPGESHCDLYSPRMRRKWAEACDKRDLASFMAFAAYRRTIYEQTVPEMRNIVSMARFNLDMQKMYNVSSSFYYNMNGMTASMYNPYVSYGAAGIPHRFETPWGVEGAQLGQRAQGYAQGINADTARVAQLQATWNLVDNAYLKSVNKKPFYEITDHEGQTIALKDVILQPDFNTHLARTKHALELAIQMEERYKAAKEEILIRLKAWWEVRYYEEANLILRLWNTNRQHCLQSALTPHPIDELRIVVTEKTYDDDKHVQRLTEKTYTDPWFAGILSKGNPLYIPAQHRLRNVPVHFAVQDRITVAHNMQGGLKDEIQDPLRNMKEAVDQAQKEERENRRKLRAAQKKKSRRWTFIKERYSVWGLPGINVEDALGLGTFAQYKEGLKEFDYTIAISLRPELMNALGAEEIRARMPWGTPFAALNDACNNRPAYAFEAMMEIDARRALMNLEE
ncbi:hypothetical protein BDV39DRAFT_205783 [Aspergillus sergii]|uniref:Uncharacterized protein n=1 Tax=Aspergillus sergii TaxID=1034303 RepID=A0A5N6X1A5_9EURO|nr:hypothetical protein BDV39DRAFT_205783 [Aspergillus sergii]